LRKYLGGKHYIYRYRIFDIGKKKMFRQFRLSRRGFLRPWVLSTIGHGPKNGAEIIDEVEKMSWGGWRPSPGSVYPLLDELMQEGLIQKREDGRYELTQKGKEESEWPFGMPGPSNKPSNVEGMLAEMRDYVSYLEDLNTSSRARVSPYSDKIKEISDRLSKLV
jgi:DNA-binding PadR family transcriptional regulator